LILGRQVELLWFDMVDTVCPTHARRVGLLWFDMVDAACPTHGRRVGLVWFDGAKSLLSRVRVRLPAMISPVGRLADFRL
jgi:hypothetical protein